MLSPLSYPPTPVILGTYRDRCQGLFLNLRRSSDRLHRCTQISTSPVPVSPATITPSSFPDQTFLGETLVRIFHGSRSGVTATTDMVAPSLRAGGSGSRKPGILRCSFDYAPLTMPGTGKTSSPCDVLLGTPIPRYRGTVVRWPHHLQGLATAIHETSGLLQYGGAGEKEANFRVKFRVKYRCTVQGLTLDFRSSLIIEVS